MHTEVTQKRLCRPPTSRPQVFQAFLHGKDQDQPKYAFPDRGVGAMEDRPRPYHRLGLQEQVLDLKYRGTACKRRDFRVRAQDADTVEARLLREFAGIDFEDRLVLHLAPLAQIAAVGRVADDEIGGTPQIGDDGWAHGAGNALVLDLDVGATAGLLAVQVGPNVRDSPIPTKYWHRPGHTTPVN